MRNWVYIMESESTGQWYYGHTSDLERRRTEHNSGNTKSTKGKGPWKLIFAKEWETKSEAVNFELKLKRLRNKEFIKKQYATFFIGV